ncbi:MAG: hypothetical protein GY765_04440 [bacterium]|nr:hypothetical protein [bacterium]
MNKATVKQVLSWHPCEDYTQERIEKLWDGREALSGLEILGLDISVEDRFWALFRNHFFSDRELRLMACDFAESVLYLYDGDSNAPAEAIRIARLFADGKATREELDAAYVAARAAARAANAASYAAADAARDANAASYAAADAARDATWAAARAACDATWAAARAAEQEKQTEIVRNCLKGGK